jgi:hypothetical protein
MATTVHAGPAWANALQGASNTAGSYRRATQETAQHELSLREGEQELDQRAESFELDKQAFAQNAKRLQAQADAEELETQIRLDERDQIKRAASVQQNILRHALRPEKAQEADPLEFEGATPQQTQQLMAVLEAGRRIRQETEAAFQLGKEVTRELGRVQVGTGDAPYMPGYAEGLAALQQQLMGWQPGAADPQELGAQLQELKRENFEFQARHDAISMALKDFQAQYGDDPELGFVKALIREGQFDEAHEAAYQIKHPRSYQKTREDAQAELIDETRQQLADQALSKALDSGLEPGTPEWDGFMDSFYVSARKLYGPDVVPYSEQEQFDQELQAFIAAEVPEEETFKALEAGLTFEEYQASQPRQIEFARPPKKAK